MDEKISIIIPVYNVENYLENCLKSVVSQSYSNLEIILVDDGTPDGSGAICDQWAKLDNRIQVIHKENAGLSSARNVGLDKATGSYVMFIDSDDIVDQDICRDLYCSIKDSGSDIAICDAEHIFNAEFGFLKSKEIIEYTAEGAIVEMWYQKSFLPSAWGKLYKAEIFRDCRFTEKILFEDIDIMHELFWNSKKIVYLKSKLYGYIHHEGSITTKKFCSRDLDILKIAQKLMGFAENKSENIIRASKAYAITAALRVYLNAPKESEYSEALGIVDEIMKTYGKEVLKDRNIRNKTKYALILYFYFRPLMRVVYEKINRWN